MKYLRLYNSFLDSCIRRELTYRFNYIVNMLTIVMGYFSNILFFYYVYNAGVEQISDWSRYEIYILQATVWIVDSIFGGIFFFNLIRVPAKVKNYDLDYILLKPINSIFLLTCRQFNLGLFSAVFFGVAFLFYSMSKASVVVGLLNVIVYIFMIACGVMILFSILFFMVTFSLKFVSIQGLIQMFWTLSDIGKQPYSIYPFVIKFSFVFIIPALIIYNFPVQVLINDNYIFGMNIAGTMTLGALVTVLLFYGAVKFFNRSIKEYYK